jgi:hypothetical protein
LTTNFSDMLKPERGGIADINPMQYEDAQAVSIGQSDSEYLLGIGARLNDIPTIGMYAT